MSGKTDVVNGRLMEAAGALTGNDKLRAEGKGLIRHALELYSLWEDGFAPRIRAVAGNLAEPALGPTPDKYRKLADEVGDI